MLFLFEIQDLTKRKKIIFVKQITLQVALEKKIGTEKTKTRNWDSRLAIQKLLGHC